jgi:hypothetical protein
MELLFSRRDREHQEDPRNHVEKPGVIWKTLSLSHPEAGNKVAMNAQRWLQEKGLPG